MTEEAPSLDELDRMSTEELRTRAFDRAEHEHDVGFFWDLLRHLPPADDAATEDPSPGSIPGGTREVMEVVRELMGRGLGDREPLVRARFISYIRGED